MAVAKAYTRVSFEAGEDLSSYQWCFVKKMSTADRVAHCSDSADVALGILVNKPDTTGEAATVTIDGIDLLKLNQDVTGNAIVNPDTTGAAIKGTSTGHVANALVLETGSAGDLVPAKLVTFQPNALMTVIG